MEIKINFKQGSTIVHTKTTGALGAGKQTIALGFVLEPGAYTIDVEGTTGELYFEASGATFPYKNDPKDRNIRLAPTLPSVEEIKLAMEVVCLCVELADAEKNA